MTPEEFLANFETLSEAPAGLNKLRELVLELATSGRLIPQLQSDEPAEASLQRNRENRRRAWLDLHGRTPYVEPSPIHHEEMPPLPHGWAWERIEFLGENPFAAVQTGPFGSQLLKTEFVSSGVPVIAVGNVGELSFKNDGRFFITRAKAEMLSRYDVRAGDLLFARTGSVGKVCVAPDYIDDWRMTGHILRLRLNKKITLPWFIAFALRGSKFVRNQVDDGVKGTTRPGFNTALLERIIVPVPPIDEQRRIIAKVDQLMALCDALDAKQTQQQETRARLTHSALDALTSAEGPEEFAAGWRRVDDNFDVLFAKTESVEELRKAILELAVRGRLVDQDSNDEPADLLLKLIATEQQSPSKTQQRNETFLEDEQDLPSLPNSWSWTPFGSLIVSGPKNGYSPKAVEYETQVKSLTLSATTTGQFDGRHFKYINEVIAPDSDLWLEDGDILIQRGNTIDYVGVAAIYRGDHHAFIYPDLMMKVRVSPRVELDFIHLALNSQIARRFIRARATGTSGSMPKISQSVVVGLPIPLPPAPEQKRIAARAKRLMTFCDELEARLRDAEKGAERLAEAMTAAMVA